MRYLGQYLRAAPLLSIWLSVALMELLIVDLIQSMLKSGKTSHCFAYVILMFVFLQCLVCEAPISA